MIGEQLKQRREKLNPSQSGLARLFGVRQATISDWESGGHQIQHPKLLDLALKSLERENKTEKPHGRRRNREAI